MNLASDAARFNPLRIDWEREIPRLSPPDLKGSVTHLSQAPLLHRRFVTEADPGPRLISVRIPRVCLAGPRLSHGFNDPAGSRRRRISKQKCCGNQRPTKTRRGRAGRNSETRRPAPRRRPGSGSLTAGPPPFAQDPHDDGKNREPDDARMTRPELSRTTAGCRRIAGPDEPDTTCAPRRPAVRQKPERGHGPDAGDEGVNVRTIGMKRARMTVFPPCRSKKARCARGIPCERIGFARKGTGTPNARSSSSRLSPASTAARQQEVEDAGIERPQAANGPGGKSIESPGSTESPPDGIEEEIAADRYVQVPYCEMISAR